MKQQKILHIEGLKTQFFTKKGVVPAVDGVDIDIPESAIVGIVGESGCGKSMTAMSILNLIQKPGKVAEGVIDFAGEDLTRCRPKRMREIRGKEISVIFQEPMTSLNPVMTVGRQVQEAICLHESISREEAKHRVLKIFAQVGIPEPGKRYTAYPHQLSGGLRQRVMIGMAMVCNPRLLIADEPTTALDVTIEAQILQLMKKLRDESQTSIMMITHNLGVVAQTCDYVYVMYAGRIMEQAEVFDLFDHTSHPYTQGLMKSIPRVSSEKGRLYNIPGMVPSLTNLPQGCRFCTRCEYALQRCFTQEPELYPVGTGHYSRCFLHESREEQL